MRHPRLFRLCLRACGSYSVPSLMGSGNACGWIRCLAWSQVQFNLKQVLSGGFQGLGWIEVYWIWIFGFGVGFDQEKGEKIWILDSDGHGWGRYCKGGARM